MKRILLVLLVSINIFGCSSTNNSESENDSTSTENKLEQGYLNLYNDDYLYVGGIKDGKPHGRGTLRSSLISDFETLKFIKEGKSEKLKNKELMLKYIGDWINGERNGYGIEWYSDGTWWDGKFKDNTFCTTCDGDVKFGSFFSGFLSSYKIIDGQKTNEELLPLTKSDIDFREGDCEGDCDFGFGTLKYYNGSLYKGYFKNSERNGSGEFTNLKGNYIGEFKNDVFHGEGKYSWVNGDKYEGEFKNGLENGYGEKTYKSGKFEKGIFKNGKLSE